jgi:hypothetical protein
MISRGEVQKTPCEARIILFKVLKTPSKVKKTTSEVFINTFFSKKTTLEVLINTSEVLKTPYAGRKKYLRSRKRYFGGTKLFC